MVMRTMSFPREIISTGWRLKCVIPMTTAMRDMEGCLQRALIVWVGGTQPLVSIQQVAQAFIF